jgi:CDP-4-dehydro-6-deoxyglucose reductase
MSGALGEPAAYRVTIQNVAARIDCGAGQTVLEAAIGAGLDYPYACATGNCGACISRLDAGTVSLLPRSDAALSAAQLAAGQTLACRARPCSDLTITWLGRGRR